MNTIRLTQVVSLWGSSISTAAPYTHGAASNNSFILQSYYTLYSLGTKAPDHHDADYYVNLLKKAFRLVVQVSQPQTGITSSPCFLQALALALIVAEKLQLGIKAIICALLYSVAKEGKVCGGSIKEAFDDDITYILQGLLWISEQPFSCDSKHTKGLSVIYYTHFSHNHLLIILLHLAEQIQKLYMLEVWQPEQQKQIVKAMESMYAPLAKNLGLHQLYLELTDNCFKAHYPTTYHQLVGQVQNNLQSSKGFLEHFAKQIYKMLQANSIACSIKGRTKSIASIYNKIQDRVIPFSAINDFYAICIVFESPLEDECTNCWYIYNLIASRYCVNRKYLRDWISKSKDSNYEALHLTIQSDAGLWVEVQIRTTRMNEIAEYGDAAHWKYKNQHTLGDAVWNHISWLTQARDYLQNNVANNPPHNIPVIVLDMYYR